MELYFDRDQTVFLWLALFAVLIARAWFGKAPVAGLGLCHLLNLALIHFFTELFAGENSTVKLLDRYAGQIGFKLTAFSILGLLAAFIAVQVSKHLFLTENMQAQVVSQIPPAKVGYLAIIFGFTAYFILGRILSFIPSITSILSSGLAVASAGMAVWYFITLKRVGPLAALGISSLSVIFPICTMLLIGFMGFGVFAILGLSCFMVCLHKPRSQMLIVAPVAVFLGLSLYPAYMKAREGIREKVWGDASYSERVTATIEGIFDKWQWFDPEDEDQLVAMNGRLNQNVLVGASYEFMTAGGAQYANGETLIDGLLALVPRVIWTDKKIQAGSGGLVARYTGIKFAEGTSIGIGNIMELFVNFGLYGVFFGFFIIGICVYISDEICGLSLRKFNFSVFFLYFSMTQAFMNVIGSFVEWGPNLIGAYVLSFVYQKLIRKGQISVSQEASS